jgi:predicted ribosomally synthesized peptide with SipW-like signal peptide
MKKKSILMAAIAVMLVAVLVVGGTLAYFTDTKSATNTFTVGDVKIKLDESNVNAPNGDRVISNEYTGVLPGIQYKKDPVVTNTGKNDAYVRAVVTIENGMNWLGFYYDDASTFPQVEAFEKLICNTLGTGWEIVGFKNVMSTQDHPTSDTVVTLKYTGVLKSGEATSAMFKNVMLPAKMTTNDITTRVAQNGVFHIDVVAQAIQTEGFASWNDAFAAFDAQK